MTQRVFFTFIAASFVGSYSIGLFAPTAFCYGYLVGVLVATFMAFANIRTPKGNK